MISGKGAESFSSSLAFSAVGIALCLYAYPLLVLYDMGPRLALRNSALLASRHVSNTVGLLGMGVLFGIAVGRVSSGLMFFLPAVWGLFIVNNCRMVLADDGQTVDEDCEGASRRL